MTKKQIDKILKLTGRRGQQMTRWEQGFVRDMFSLYRSNNGSELTPNQDEILSKIYRTVFLAQTAEEVV